MFVVQIAFHDPTPELQILNRSLLPFIKYLDKMELDERGRGQLVTSLTVVARKLASVWRNLDDYRKAEDGLTAKVREPDLIGGEGKTKAELRFDLYDACDGFLVQTKSALDHLVKVPVPIFGERVWTLRRFGDKGESVLRALKRNVPSADAERLKDLPDLFSGFEPWLDEVITLRDRVNHGLDGGLEFEWMDVRLEETDNSNRLVVPMWSDTVTLREALEVFWGRLLAFVEQFTGAIVFLRLKSEYAAAGVLSEKHDAMPRWIVLPKAEVDEMIRELDEAASRPPEDGRA